MTKSAVISKRYDFVLLFDVKDGNPNGNPDADNMPRFDPETLHGLVTDVCLKRKIRNYVQITKHKEPAQVTSNYVGDPYDIFIREGNVLNTLIDDASKQAPVIIDDLGQEGTLFEGVTPPSSEIKVKKNQVKKKDDNEVRAHLCSRYYDVRTFGAVVSTGSQGGKAGGQIRGPVQMTFARSIAPIITLGHSITRCAVTNEKNAKKERTMGRKHTISYGLYKAYGFVTPNFADQTKFSEKDLKILWEALLNMFDLDHSAARGLMSTRELIVFKHKDRYGNAQSSALFDLVKVVRKGKKQNTDNNSLDSEENNTPARSFDDYEVKIDRENLPYGVEIFELPKEWDKLQNVGE